MTRFHQQKINPIPETAGCETVKRSRRFESAIWTKETDETELSWTPWLFKNVFVEMRRRELRIDLRLTLVLGHNKGLLLAGHSR